MNSNFRLYYRARTDFPSIDQLQDVLDISNPLNVSGGNPLLKQEYTHFGSARYSFVNRKTGHSFFANFFGQMTNDYITNAVYYLNADSVIQNIELKEGSQFSKPINLNGYKQLNAFLTYSFPFNAIKSNLNLSGGFTYVDRPGSINNLITKTTNNALSGGIVWASNISEYVDFNLNYNANFNNAKSEYPDELVLQNLVRNSNTRYINQSAGVFLNLLSKNGWFMQNDVSNQTYSGLSEGFNTSYWLWNAAIGKKFLKNKAGELKLSVFDLLKQNQSVSRSIGANNTITDEQSRVLQQYFMLTFTYSLRNFGKGKASSSNNEGGEKREWRGGPPGGGMPGGSGRPGGGPMF
ncbi:outer membrane beta-barrel protein [Niabella ginsengisoli]|uniref:Outer membrane beta-barrel family protein n=1 Tax=Niabella ginsengisoli TaxID=522298 RepID=A0ABS9SPG3_9BACT|nr:outer membrane beta-barrel protein [Niabella ginsengisoli]MCH5600255.1 outer membrane beta-barrel family protein [Niabella ginsengisoli]